MVSIAKKAQKSNFKKNKRRDTRNNMITSKSRLKLLGENEKAQVPFVTAAKQN